MAHGNEKPVVIITGGSGFIGGALVDHLAYSCNVVGFDLAEPKELPAGAAFERVDLTSIESVRQALAAVRKRHGNHIASVIHLAAYFDLTGKPSPKYEQITVRGTARLLRELQAFDVEQFMFGSSMLAHTAGRPGDIINEDTPLDTSQPYAASKVKTERLIHAERGSIPVVYLRPAGVYDEFCRNTFLAHQIARIYEGDVMGHFYPGDLNTGQSFLHIDDLADAVKRLIERRTQLAPELPLLLGEPEVIGYGKLQEQIGELIQGESWETWQVPKILAKAGVWIADEVLGEEPFIRPWMVDIAEDHYAIDITRARDLLGWEPRHSLRETLPRMIGALKADPAGWYRLNKLNAGRIADTRERLKRPEPPRNEPPR